MILLKKISTLCKSAKHIVLHTTYCGQWLGTPQAMYAMSGMPKMDEDTVLAVLDIAEKDRNKLLVDANGSFDADQYTEFAAGADDVPQAVMAPIVVKRDGVDWCIFQPSCEAAVFFVNSDYLAPIKGRNISYHLRHDDEGQAVIAVKDGAILCAVLWPDETVKAYMGPELLALSNCLCAAVAEDDGEEATP